jgi:hypothetical protein
MGLSDTLTDAFLQTLCQHMGSALFRNHHLAFLLRLSLDLLRYAHVALFSHYSNFMNAHLIFVHSVRGDALQEEIEYLQNQTKSVEALTSLSRFSGMDSLFLKFTL